MLEIENATSNHNTAQNNLAQAESQWQSNYDVLVVEQRHLSVEIRKSGVERESVAASIPKGAMSLYDSLLRQKDGLAVANVKKDMCQGCRLVLSSHELQRAKAADAIVQCSSCHRILCFG